MTTGWKLNHVGMISGKKNKLLQFYHDLGIGVSVGPQPLLPHREGAAELMIYQTLNGNPISQVFDKPGAHTFFDGQSQIGTLQLECIQPVPGTFLGAYQETKGDGINHLCFNVPDVEAETERLITLGCDLMFCAKTGGEIVENYLDTRKHGDVIISLRPPSEHFEEAWQENNRAHPLVKPWTFRGLSIAVASLEESLAYYKHLGFGDTTKRPLGMASTGVEVGPITFEFWEPSGRGHMIPRTLERRGEGVFAIDFTTPDLEGAARKLEESGIKRLKCAVSKDGPPSVLFETRTQGNTALRLIAEE